MKLSFVVVVTKQVVDVILEIEDTLLGRSIFPPFKRKPCESIVKHFNYRSVSCVYTRVWLSTTCLKHILTVADTFVAPYLQSLPLQKSFQLDRRSRAEKEYVLNLLFRCLRS